MEDIQILTCPFCNGKSEITCENEMEIEISCTFCGLCIYKSNNIEDFRSICINSWNKRTNGWDE